MPRRSESRSTTSLLTSAALRALDVDDRRFAGDRDRFLERADPQVGVHRGDERARQLDAFALDGAETRAA